MIYNILTGLDTNKFFLNVIPWDDETLGFKETKESIEKKKVARLKIFDDEGYFIVEVSIQ